MRKTMYLLSAMMPLIGSCATNSPSADFCEYAHPIYLDKKDSLTSDTKRAILSHDITGVRLCDWERI